VHIVWVYNGRNLPARNGLVEVEVEVPRPCRLDRVAQRPNIGAVGLKEGLTGRHYVG
jgi:hypothetical protein